ncbi:SEN1 N terminal-domain-containing protein [Amylocarpus encephaloides]|uniref:SEN1 N terminal-domain-containing protein n=1 Tax=Amylocarpus encephaloides TaxID=45428 RepID=A0A9P7YP47_9HELO|nr:SEN1 N terminal-domain-containing protein [Amylocarpus encephaloides]
MPSEDEIKDELKEDERLLRSFPPDAHWFCPKIHAEDNADYIHADSPDEDEDGKEIISVQSKQKAIRDGEDRYKVAMRASLVFGIGEENMGDLYDYYSKRMDSLFVQCDRCISRWHKGRKAHEKSLAEIFDDSVTAEILHRFDAVDFNRINKGLGLARKHFEAVEPSQRKQTLLLQHDDGSIQAVYETLCCVKFHASEENLAKDFNFVFSALQKKKVLRIEDALPASTRFLFHEDAIRLRFAENAWRRMGATLTPDLFNWAVHDALADAIVQVSSPSPNQGDVRRFWNGFLLLMNKLDPSLITHSLRGMEVQPDVYHLGLQHLNLDLGLESEEIVQYILEAFSQLLQKSPKDFWSALGTVSPKAVAEFIFASSGFIKVLENKKNLAEHETNPAISWIPVFIQSLEPIHQSEACRSLLYNLCEGLQKTHISAEARALCCRAGLDALRATLSTFTSPTYKVNPSTSLLIINDDLMDLVDKYTMMIVGCADLGESDSQLKKIAMAVIQEALALDCKAIHAEFHALQDQTPLQRGSRTHSQPIWQAVLDIFRPGNLEVAKNILSATNTLTGLDIMMPGNKKRPELLPGAHAQYNKDYRQLMDNIARVFERLTDFEPPDLKVLAMNSITARPLFAALVSSNQGIYEAAVAVMKTMTMEHAKQDTIEALLRDLFVPMLSSLTFAVIKITRAKTFSPTPYAIKIGRELLTALCDSTGRLRSSTLSSAERGALLTWWKSQWRLMDMVFSTTESWAPRVDKPTSYMQDFCRDGMEYAEALFNEHSVFASGITEPLADDKPIDLTATSPKEKILDVVCQNVDGLTSLLRLRDSWLISVITSLLGKLLRCLGESNLEIDFHASNFIKAACKRENQRDFRKTNLTLQQKAELQRALDDHQGIEYIEPPPASTSTVKKQGTIDAWSQSADGKRHEPKLPINATTLTLNSQSEKNRAVVNAMRAQAIPNGDINAFKEKRRRAEAEKQREKSAAIAKAKALRAPAGVRGEGSGLKDIGGVVGKDHAPIRSEIMVGSSDEDSDDDDDDDDEDETGVIIKSRKSAVSDYEESRKKALKMQQQGPVRKTKIVRSAKDLRARVEPNMDRLYIEILDWDLFHPGDDPPTSNECRRIADSFIELDVYKKTFTPLLISEVWRSLVTAREENNSKPIAITVMNRLSVDKFMEVSTQIPMTAERDKKVAERDIVLLSKNPDPMSNPDAPHCLARVQRTSRKKDVIEVTFKISRSVTSELLSSLTAKSKIHAVKIADMTTTQREYAALSSLEYYDLCNEVLEAKPSPIQKYSEEKISTILSKYNLNKGQSQAILSAHDNDGFTLIQGPPGSGKTKTIIAMVGALMTQTLQQAQTRAPAPMPGRGDQPPPTAGPKKKLLICAPSNAAVDELVLRLKEGVQPLNGPRRKINVIRIGRSDAVNDSVKDMMLDELVRRKLEGDNGEKNKLIQDRDQFHKDAGQIKEQLRILRPQMDTAREKGDKAGELVLQRKFDELKRKQAFIGNKIDEEKQSGNTVSRQNEINRRRYQQEIIDGAHVLCATLSGSGHDMFRNLSVEFETVIIDEAAQCIELSALIPLKYGCSKCILVGDPEQLPPTVLSRSAQSFGYEQSLFVRMQRNHPKDVHLLDTQYRMHPDISKFPSKQFYHGRLVDGEGMAKLRRQPWHASTILSPYRFFDVEGVQTKEARGHSFINVPELNAAIRLYQRLKADYSNHDFTGKIGIITTYKAQLNAMKDRFGRQFGPSITDEIEFNTTDAFQGREREIIIFSCVRAKATGGIGFLGDIRRMNVGLTRAKSSLWVLGDSRSLQQGEFWNRLIQDAKDRNKYSGGDVMGLLSRPSSREPPPSSPVVPTNGHAGFSQMGPSTRTDQEDYLKFKDEDQDVEMTDATTASRMSWVIGGSDTNPTGYPQNGNGVKMEESKAADNAIVPTSTSLNTHGKRPAEPASDDETAIKKLAPPRSEGTVDLDAALRAQQAKKPPPRPVRPPGVAPPRRKQVADPFIQRRPAKRG